MSRRPRFELVEILDRGYRVAVVHDSKPNRDFKVYFKNGRVRHWDAGRDDEPIGVPALRDFAKAVLA